MTQLQMERAARIADAQTRAIALYQAEQRILSEFSPLIFAAAFSGLLWTIVLARILHILA